MKPLNLEELMQQELTSSLNDGSVRALIKKNLDQSITEIIKRSFSYGKASDALKEKVEASLIENVDAAEMPNFTAILSSQIKAVIAKHVETNAVDELMNEIENQLLPPPKEITIKEALEPLMEQYRSEFSEACEDPSEYIELYMSEVRTSDYGSKWAKLEIKGFSACYSPEHLTLQFCNGKIFSITADRGKATLLDFGYGAQANLAKLMIAKTVFTDWETFDTDEIDTHVGNDY